MRKIYLIPTLFCLSSCSYNDDSVQSSYYNIQEKTVLNESISNEKYSPIKHDLKTHDMKLTKMSSFISSFKHEVGEQGKFETNSEYLFRWKKFSDKKGVFLVCNKVNDFDIDFNKDNGYATWITGVGGEMLMYGSNLLDYPSISVYRSHVVNGGYVASNVFGADVDVDVAKNTSASFILEQHSPAAYDTVTFEANLTSPNELHHANVCYSVSLEAPYVFIEKSKNTPTITSPESTTNVDYYFRVELHDVFFIKDGHRLNIDVSTGERSLSSMLDLIRKNSGDL